MHFIAGGLPADSLADFQASDRSAPAVLNLTVYELTMKTRANYCASFLLIYCSPSRLLSL
jgi:hypothetical protein